MYHEIEALPAILSNSYIDNLISEHFTKFSKIILISDKKLPQLGKCSECPSTLGNLKLSREGNFSKIFI